MGTANNRSSVLDYDCWADRRRRSIIDANHFPSDMGEGLPHSDLQNKLHTSTQCRSSLEELQRCLGEASVLGIASSNSLVLLRMAIQRAAKHVII